MLWVQGVGWGVPDGWRGITGRGAHHWGIASPGQLGPIAGEGPQTAPTSNGTRSVTAGGTPLNEPPFQSLRDVLVPSAMFELKDGL